MSERRDQIIEILRKPYRRVVVPDGPDAFLARISEFAGCMALEPTASGALARLEEVAIGWVESALERGVDIPEPDEELSYSGKLMLRLPKSLHQKAAEAAVRDDVSLNQFIVAALAEHLGAKKAQKVQVGSFDRAVFGLEFAGAMAANSSATRSVIVRQLFASPHEIKSAPTDAKVTIWDGEPVKLNG
jgi:antitoxin HicB